ncbi:MAG TPA: hypothetical protein VEW72_03345 [Burkholderiales bacterium]|nr:hypothetical protein [Burkholderiales bacterium]
MSISPQDDRLWVPLLTHYRRQGQAVEIDPDRIAAHVSYIRPWVRQFLLAGSTGDGWEMSLEQLLVLVRLTARPDLSREPASWSVRCAPPPRASSNGRGRWRTRSAT